jgi:nitrogen fixation protein FixH
MFRLKREHGWPAAICTILGITVALNVWVMRVANDDPSMVVEPNYYARAIRWDDEMAQARRNAALAWTVTPTLGATDAGRAELRVSVRDAHGAPIDGAAVTLEAFAILRSGDVVHATLAPDGDGYRTSVPMRTRGRWELRFTVVRGGDRFTAVQRVDAVGGRVPDVAVRGA